MPAHRWLRSVRARMAQLLLCLIVAALTVAGPAQANWFTKLVKEAGEAGGDAATTAGRMALGTLDEASQAVRRLPKAPDNGLSFAAHVTPEGHWTFSNREGVAFTAATREELGRVRRSLAPEAPPEAGLDLYLSSTTVFQRARRLGELPGDARLRLVWQGRSFPITARNSGSETTVLAAVRPHVMVRLKNPSDFAEAVWQFERPLDRSRLRVLSLKTGGPVELLPRPRLDKAKRSPVADDLDPRRLRPALEGVSGQTLVLIGRIEGDALRVQPAGGAVETLPLTELREAAAAADVNLIVLRSKSPLQPGTQNWLWQTIEVDGLERALSEPTYGGFLNALAGRSGRFVADVTRGEDGRVQLVARADRAEQGIVESVGAWWDETVSDVAGNVVTEGLSAFLTASERQKELDERIVPGVPSDVQFYAIGALAMGLLAFSTAYGWWRRIWPKENRTEYRGAFGYWAARGVRWSIFLFLFLPIVGPFALVASIIAGLFGWVVKLFRWLQGSLGSGNAGSR